MNLNFLTLALLYYTIIKMKNSTSPVIWIAGILAILPLFYLAAIYPGLPNIVPTHFDMDGKPNDYSEKSTLIFLTVLFSALSFGSFLLWFTHFWFAFLVRFLKAFSKFFAIGSEGIFPIWIHKPFFAQCLDQSVHAR